MKIIPLLSAGLLISCHSDEKETSKEEQTPAKQEKPEQTKEAHFPELVFYSGTPESEGQSSPIERKPSAPSASMSKVIAANTGSPMAIPIPRPTPQPRVPATPEEPAVTPDFKTATPVPGKPGYFFNPWTSKVVDVRGVPKGAIVRDQNDPDPSHKFRIPE